MKEFSKHPVRFQLSQKESILIFGNALFWFAIFSRVFETLFYPSDLITTDNLNLVANSANKCFCCICFLCNFPLWDYDYIVEELAAWIFLLKLAPGNLFILCYAKLSFIMKLCFKIFYHSLYLFLQFFFRFMSSL